MRYLNAFIIIGLMLLAISLAGAATGNRFLTEPGQPLNPYAWLEYLGASALMIVNGVVSIRLAKAAEQEKAELASAKQITIPTTPEDDTPVA